MKSSTAPLGSDVQGRAAILLAVLTLAVLLVLAAYRSPLSRVWGDEGTFLAMMASLTADGDLRFDAPDLARVEAAVGGRTHLILQRDGDGIAYSKPVLYAVAAAPFYAALGERGPMLLNLLTFGFALMCAHAWLRRLGGAGAAALVLVTFTGAAVVVPYLAWRMTDALQCALALIALSLCFGTERGQQTPICPPPGERLAKPGIFDRLIAWPGAPLVGAALLGALANMRISNAVLAAAPILAALAARRFRHAVLVALAAAAAYLALAGLALALTGAPNPYRAARTSFTPATGYPAGAGAEVAMARFESAAASDRTGLRPHFGARQIAYAGGYFFFGRHTGLVFYFPAAVMFLLFALRHGDRTSRAALLAFAAAIVFFIAWRAENYFGGDTFIGNRYFLSIYPLLLIALPRLPGPRLLFAAWILAAVSYASALTSVISHHQLDAGSQNHTRAGIFRRLPYESTSRNIVGRRDRYWAGHFLRFVDPFPGVGPLHFDLHAGRPPAEVLIAHWRPLNTIRLWVEASAAEATLEIWNRGRRSAFAVGAEVGAAGPEPSRGLLGVPVNLETSPPWRRHRYWWHPETVYSTRALRLRLATPDNTPASAKVRYFGDLETLEQSFSYQLTGESLPPSPAGGSTSRVSFTVRNTSPLIWEAEDVVPVAAGYRLYDAAGELVAESPHIPLPSRVEPFHRVEVAFEVAWPEAPGSYRLEADLVLEHIAWFAERLGSPVLEREILIP